MFKLTIVAFLFLLSGTVPAQETKPYAGQQDREIKALSVQEVQDYLDGKGAGLAKAAELNHYPGPAHVLELTDKLRLTPQQKARTQNLFVTMNREARALGAALIEKERELDLLFANGTIDNTALASRLRDIGRLQAEVRGAHLRAHVEQRAILTSMQIALYDVLRGYGENVNAQSNRSHHH